MFLFFFFFVEKVIGLTYSLNEMLCSKNERTKYFTNSFRSRAAERLATNRFSASRATKNYR